MPASNQWAAPLCAACGARQTVEGGRYICAAPGCPGLAPLQAQTFEERATALIGCTFEPAEEYVRVMEWPKEWSLNSRRKCWETALVAHPGVYVATGIVWLSNGRSDYNPGEGCTYLAQGARILALRGRLSGTRRETYHPMPDSALRVLQGEIAAPTQNRPRIKP